MSRKVPIGRIVRAHGLKGEVKFLPYTLNQELFSQVTTLYRRKGGFFVPLKLESIKKAPGGGLLFGFREIRDIEEAERLKNEELWIDLKDLPPLKEGEFYHYQLLGLEIIQENGQILGKVKGIIPVGPYDLLEISPPEGKSFYLPMIEEIILKIDLQKGVIVVKPPEGLIESQR